jgi:hypothetical protein
LKVEDEDKTAFITPHGVYCYMTMPFGLKNARATYQRCMQACLKEQIGRNIEVYVYDIVIKTAKADSLLDDLREIFANLDRYSIKLNPKKCSFGVPTGQLLGYLISERGIKGNPEKIQAIINMQPPKTLRHVQQLTGRLAALSRFISKFLSAASEDKQLHVDRRSASRVRQPQASSVDLPSSRHTPRERADVAIHRGYKSSRQLGTCGRTRGGRQRARSTEARILPEQSFISDQAKIPPLSEASIRHLYDGEETAALL